MNRMMCGEEGGGGRAAVPNTVLQAVAPPSKSKNEYDVAVLNNKMNFKKKEVQKFTVEDTPPSGLPLPSGRLPPQGHHEMCCSKQCTRFLGCHYQSTKFLFLRREF